MKSCSRNSSRKINFDLLLDCFTAHWAYAQTPKTDHMSWSATSLPLSPPSLWFWLIHDFVQRVCLFWCLRRAMHSVRPMMLWLHCVGLTFKMLLCYSPWEIQTRTLTRNHVDILIRVNEARPMRPLMWNKKINDLLVPNWTLNGRHDSSCWPDRLTNYEQRLVWNSIFHLLSLKHQHFLSVNRLWSQVEK